MKNYFTISEFASLRNININSLRYYEKIGLLKPAYIAPDTHYRYYSAKQIPVLDTILLCIDLKIPLKELSQYIDETGVLHSEKLFQDGKRIAQQRIDEIQTELSKIEYARQDMETSSMYGEQSGLYKRVIRNRRFWVSEYTTGWEDLGVLEKNFTHLYSQAQEKNLAPIFPPSLLLQYHNQQIRCFLLCEITDRKSSDEQILEIPEGEFSCLQEDLLPTLALNGIVERYFSDVGTKTLIITNLMLTKYQIDNRKNEVQFTDRIFF